MASNDELDAASALLELTQQVHQGGVREDKSVQVDTSSATEKFSLSKFLTSVKELQIFTGVHSFELLDFLVNLVSSVFKETFKGKYSHELKDRVILTFCKLKLNLSYECLSVLFHISPSCSSNYFRTTVQQLAFVCEAAVFWPTKDQILSNLPLCFENFPKTRVILDCFEVPIEKSKCLSCRISTYSHYKGTNTIKAMVGIAPSGLITCISQFFGGRASDKAIALLSGVLKLCEPGDAIMVDKGFLIEHECSQKGIHLIRPPFLGSKNNLSENECHLTADIAAARVHVERSIQRIRLFKILAHRLPLTLIPYADDVLKVIVALVNLGNPILANNKFNHKNEEMK